MGDTAMALDRDAALVLRLAGCRPVVTRGFLRSYDDSVKLVTCDGTIVAISNAGWAKVVSRKGADQAAEMIGAPVWTVWGTDTQPQIREALLRARLGGPVTVAVHSDESEDVRDVEFTAVRDPSNRVIYILVLSRLRD